MAFNHPNGAVIEIGGVARGYAEKTVTLKLIQGQWPNENDLVTIADGYGDLIPRHFGGQVVSLGASEARVKVWID